jgi:hypothetical protein
MHNNQLLIFILLAVHAFVVVYMLITAPNISMCTECPEISLEMHIAVIVWIVGIQMMLFRLLLSLDVM